MLRRIWHWWKRVSHAIGNFQARVVLTVFWALIVLPTGVAVRLFSDPLQLRRSSAPTHLLPRLPADETLVGAGREF